MVRADTATVRIHSESIWSDILDMALFDDLLDRNDDDDDDDVDDDRMIFMLM